MTSSTAKSDFWRGFGDGMPFVLGAGPFGLLFAVLATEAGLDVYQVIVMSLLVIAGAAQFAALSQMQDAAPVAMVLMAGLAVNMRMAMYSAALTPHLKDAPFWHRAWAAYILVDNSYAVGIVEFEENPDTTWQTKIQYYLGCALPVWIVWYIATFVGAFVGQAIPASIPIDFAVALTFLALVGPMLWTLPHVAAAFVSAAGTLMLWTLPYNSGLMVAAILAMIVGVQVENWVARRT